MNKNIDLTKILKDCPKGTKLYTPIWGEVVFSEVKKNKNYLYPICINTDIDGYVCLTKDGRYLINKEESECILFPSKDQRDWSKFTAPWYKKEKSIKPKFKAGDRIRHKETNKDDVYEISKVYDDSYGIVGFNWGIYMKYQDQYELVSNKFNPKTLKPFDKVIVRYDNFKWKVDLFSHYETVLNDHYKCISDYYKYCIPYNKDTKHLVGTTEEAPEYYRYWEE